jgi:hypothetical protein
MNTPKNQRGAVDLHRLIRHLRGRDRHYNASELMTEAADALESLIVDKERLDVLETVSCWIGLEDDGCHAKTKWSAGGVYVHTVREVADSYLPNDRDDRQLPDHTEKPKWIQSVGKKNSGLFRCPKCGGEGWREEDPGDWVSWQKCSLCKGTGEVPKRILSNAVITEPSPKKDPQ